MRILSLGAGVQSSALAMMMKHGEIEKADLVVFADTCCEPAAVYRWLGWLVPNMGMPFLQVKAGDGLTAAIEAACNGTAKRASSLPLFTANGGRVCPAMHMGFQSRADPQAYPANAGKGRNMPDDTRHIV